MDPGKGIFGLVVGAVITAIVRQIVVVIAGSGSFGIVPLVIVYVLAVAVTIWAVSNIPNPGNRWLVAAAGVAMQVALGAVYAWSVFVDPLDKKYGWTKPEVTWTFTIAIFTLGVAAFVGGLWMARSGPRIVAITAGLFYGIGVFLASLTGGNLWLLYLTYGLIGGIGLGLGYIVPVATLVKWFPDKRGFITGVAVAGFGAGALITAPIATPLIAKHGPLTTFGYLGIAYLVVVVIAALFMRNPPTPFEVPGWTPSATLAGQRAARDYTLGDSLRTWQWYALWALLFLNVTAGISIISVASPMTTEITGATALRAASLVGTISIANGAGRFLWAWLSDYIGRKWVFLAMFLLQAVLFFLIPLTNSFGILTILTFIILLCYGGGFGTMPAFAADYFGPANVGKVYGLMLTAWGTASVLGPQLITRIHDAQHSYTPALQILGGIMLVSAILPFIVRPPKPQAAAMAPQAAPVGR